jgi:putative nicotinate phosphoribosyltransferase
MGDFSISDILSLAALAIVAALFFLLLFEPAVAYRVRSPAARADAREFVDYLEKWRFTGDVHAMPEGTIFFPSEPIIRVTAPIPQAQLVETRLINLLHFQTLIASKAVRAVLVAPGKGLIDFGLRRAHGAEAGLLAARASYLTGFAGSATALSAS